MAELLHHRDATPKETVDRIKGLLTDLGIVLSEVAWHEGVDEARSLAVIPAAFLESRPCPSANGKGATAELARASAYGEFMERLQNSTRQTPALLPRRFGLMETELADPPDACLRTLGDLLDGGSQAVGDLLRLFDIQGQAARKQEVVCFPFFNATLGRLELLPAALLYKSCLSNGMAAGNSPAEALVHALSEIFERFATARAYRERLRLPTIPHRDLAGLPVYKSLERLIADGLHVIVKDCSFGGIYPVVALILFDPRRNRYLLKFGCDPFLDIALQRCVTEICQGVEYQALRGEMLPLVWAQDEPGRDLRIQDQPLFALERFIIDSDAQFASSIFVSAGEPRHHEAFVTGPTDSRRLLHHLARMVSQQGYQLLVRDVSYLGFPAYYVYVPRMSDAAASRMRLPGKWRPQRLLARLADASPAEIAAWLETATREAAGYDARAWAQDLDAISWFGLMVDEASGLPRLYYSEVLFAELACRLGQYKRAAMFLGRHFEKMRQKAFVDLEKMDYSWCALAALHLRAQGLPEREETATLADLFGSRPAAEVRRNLAWLTQPAADPMWPRCGDCSQCALQPHCFYPSYRALVELLNHRMAGNRIDQSGLASMFQALQG